MVKFDDGYLAQLEYIFAISGFLIRCICIPEYLKHDNGNIFNKRPNEFEFMSARKCEFWDLTKNRQPEIRIVYTFTRPKLKQPSLIDDKQVKIENFKLKSFLSKRDSRK